jgi:hypothetical protein
MQKGPADWQGLLILSRLAVWLDRRYVGRTWAFFALSDLEFDLLTFIKGSIARRLNFRVVDKEVTSAIVRGNKTKSLS